MSTELINCLAPPPAPFSKFLYPPLIRFTAWFVSCIWLVSGYALRNIFKLTLLFMNLIPELQGISRNSTFYCLEICQTFRITETQWNSLPSKTKAMNSLRSFTKSAKSSLFDTYV